MSASNSYDLVRQAVLEKKQIVAEYHGHEREMCPHTLGTKRGREQALFLQFGGSSSSGLGIPENNWRCIPIEGLNRVTIRNGPWHTASNHSQQQTCIDEIDVEVDH